jgi:hypothetical protein
MMVSTQKGINETGYDEIRTGIVTEISLSSLPNPSREKTPQPAAKAFIAPRIVSTNDQDRRVQYD